MTNEKTMTKREFLDTIVSYLDGKEITNQEELKSYALAQIAKMDEMNAHRKETKSKSQIENEKLKAEIVEKYAGLAVNAPTVAVEMELSTAKASALLRQLTQDGKCSMGEEKVKGMGVRKVYTFVIDEAE